MNDEPMLISGIRSDPSGEVVHLPESGRGKLGTTAKGFLHEYDDAIYAAYARGYRDAVADRTSQ